MSHINPYHRYQALGAYSTCVNSAIRSLKVALDAGNLPDYERAFIEDALRNLVNAAEFDKQNDAEFRAAAKA